MFSFCVNKRVLSNQSDYDDCFVVFNVRVFSLKPQQRHCECQSLHQMKQQPIPGNPQIHKCSQLHVLCPLFVVGFIDLYLFIPEHRVFLTLYWTTINSILPTFAAISCTQLRVSVCQFIADPELVLMCVYDSQSWMFYL